MVLEGAMKRMLSILLGSGVTFILGTLLLTSITSEIYYKIMNLLPGLDAANKLPGGILGNWLYKKYLIRRNSRKTEKSR